MAGVFIVGPIVTLLFRLPEIYEGTETCRETLSNGFMAVVWMVICVPGFIVLGPLGALAGSVSYFRFRKSVTNLRWCTIGCAIITDLIIASSVVVLTLVIRN